MTVVKVIKYQATKYDPQNVTGRYIRCIGQKRKGFTFLVFETETDNRTGKLGCGPTLREYETNGTEIPEEIKAKAIETKQTTLWDNPKGLVK